MTLFAIFTGMIGSILASHYSSPPPAPLPAQSQVINSSAIPKIATTPPKPSTKQPTQPLVVVRVQGDSPPTVRQFIRSKIENELTKQGVSIGLAMSRNISRVIEITINQSIINNNAYGSKTYSANCNGSVQITDSIDNRILDTTVVSAPKAIVAFDRENATSNCINMLINPINAFLRKKSHFFLS